MNIIPYHSHICFENLDAKINSIPQKFSQKVQGLISYIGASLLLWVYANCSIDRNKRLQYRHLNDLKIIEKKLKKAEKSMIKEPTRIQFRDSEFSAIQKSFSQSIQNLAPQEQLNEEKGRILIQASDWSIFDTENFGTTINRLFENKVSKEVAANWSASFCNLHEELHQKVYAYRLALDLHLISYSKIKNGLNEDVVLLRAAQSIQETYQKFLEDHADISDVLNLLS